MLLKLVAGFLLVTTTCTRLCHGRQVVDVEEGDTYFRVETNAAPDEEIALNNERVFQSAKIVFQKSEMASFPVNLFEVFPNVTELDMSICRIKTVKQSHFVNGTNLRVLLLQGNNIERLPSGAFMYLQNLEHLDLGSNDLKDLYPDTFVGLRNLKELRLYYNKITSVEAVLLRPLGELRRLDLTINEIGTVPDELFLSNPLLEDINLGYCGVQSVGRNSFVHLKHLKSLTIGHNNFPKLYLPSLDQLVAFYSHIKECYIDGSVRKILMDHNDLEVFHIRNVSLATEISLANNKLKDFRFLMPARKLQFLDISVNPITPASLVPELFSQMTELYELNLSNTNLGELDSRMFANLVSLRKLYLLDNRFVHFDYQLFVPLKKLNTLDMRGNNVTSFDLDALRATGFSSEVFGWKDGTRQAFSS